VVPGHTAHRVGGREARHDNAHPLTIYFSRASYALRICSLSIDWLVFGFLRATTLRLPQRPTLCGGRLSVIVTTSKRSASNARRLSTEKTVGSSGVGRSEERRVGKAV